MTIAARVIAFQGQERQRKGAVLDQRYQGRFFAGKVSYTPSEGVSFIAYRGVIKDCAAGLLPWPRRWSKTPAIVSVFAGRVDTGVDPVLHMMSCLGASIASCSAVVVGEPPRAAERLQADDVGRHIITVTKLTPGRARLVSKRPRIIPARPCRCFIATRRRSGYTDPPSAQAADWT